MIPRTGSQKLVTVWIAIIVAASFVAAVDDGWLVYWAALSPERIWRGEVWRLVTWIAIEPSVVNLVVTCVCIYRFGGELVEAWGAWRLQRFMVQIVVVAALVTSLVGLVFDGIYRTAGWVVDDALVIAWARQFPTQSVIFYGMLELRGTQLVTLTVGTTLLFAVFFGVDRVPELVACTIAALYPTRLARF